MLAKTVDIGGNSSDAGSEDFFSQVEQTRESVRRRGDLL
jgi:hypothetical protein